MHGQQNIKMLATCFGSYTEPSSS